MSKITFQSVVVKYRIPISNSGSAFRDLIAVDDMSFSIKSGDRVGVIGRNGAGKSTLLSLITKDLKPHSGKVLVEGDMLPLINRISGLIPQATLRENAKIKGLSFFLKGESLSSYIDSVLEYSMLEDRGDSSLNSLSTGMSGRFNIALNSQVVKPITVMDEWVGTLDVSGQQGSSLLNRLAEEAEIVIMASHNEHLIRQLCNRIILLEQGVILYDGPNLNRAFRRLSEIKKVNIDFQYSAQRLKLFFDRYRHSRVKIALRKRNLKGVRKRFLYDLREYLELRAASEYISEAEAIDDSLSEEIVPEISSDVKVKLHFLHIGKTAGYLLRKTFQKQYSSEYHLVFHSIHTRVLDIPVGEKIVILVRHPVDRFARAFFSRMNSGKPFYISTQSANEIAAFKKFRTPNQLAETLSQEFEAACYAFKAMFDIQFLNQPLSNQLGSAADLISRENDILYLGDAANVLDKLGALAELIGVDYSACEKPNEAEKNYFSTVFSELLSRKAIDNLLHYYELDIEFFDFLKNKFQFDLIDQTIVEKA